MDTAMETQPPGGTTGASREGQGVDDRELQGDEQLTSQLAERARAGG